MDDHPGGLFCRTRDSGPVSAVRVRVREQRSLRSTVCGIELKWIARIGWIAVGGGSGDPLGFCRGYEFIGDIMTTGGK